MNKNALKKFARQVRSGLISIISTKLDYILSAKDDTELKNKAKQIEELETLISKSSKEEVVEKVAYTWFNRFVALRFMDANNYTFMNIVTPPQGYTQPEILAEAKKGYIPGILKVDKEYIDKLLSGEIPAKDAQNEVYRHLLVAVCNYYHSIMPFLFEKINDYTELLLPDDLLSDNSILSKIVSNISVEDCENVEILGWLYQFYISEKKDAVINAKKRYKKDEIPAATQLFTPHWMVQYIVDNTLGRLWLEARPDSGLREHMEFYIEPTDKDKIPERKINSPEEITFLDPACGSGHILVYAFELLSKIYEEEGYDKTEIPQLILQNNLYGLEIDERAAEIASFALTMKATRFHRRYLRKAIKPKIYTFINSNDYEFFREADTLGSLIRIDKDEFESIKVEEDSIFADRQRELKQIASLLRSEYDCVVTNPPYMNRKYFNKVIGEYVKTNYASTTADLFAAFAIRSSELCYSDGMIGLVTPFVWMFIKSYEYLREFIINNTTLISLVRPSYTAFFDSAIVPLNAFILRNEKVQDYKSVFFDLGYLGNAGEQIPRLKEALNNKNSDKRFTKLADNFQKIPGSPISYWVRECLFEVFKNGSVISDYATITASQNKTAKNEVYVRFNWEISRGKLGNGNKWVTYFKGGDFRKWYGNLNWVVDWSESARDFYDKNPTSNLLNENYWFKEGITYTELTTKEFSCRYMPSGGIFDMAGPGIIIRDINYFNFFLALFNSKIAGMLFKLFNPTFHIKNNDLLRFPIIFPKTTSEYYEIINIAAILTDISKYDWDTHETSNGFKKNEIIKHNANNLLQTSYIKYCDYWQNQFSYFYKNEDDLNRMFFKIYGLSPSENQDVHYKDITILQNETYINESNELVFKKDKIIKQFISYSVGCMFGRYSLDREGLILANQGETLEDYLKQVPNPTFTPDEDAIIPILENDYFMDDIAERFKQFLKASFGEEHFDENLRFVEEAVGRDIRSFFLKDFYDYHVRMYKKRPIYWMFSSPNKGFNALIYMHRYQPDTVSKILNNYLREFITKLTAQKENWDKIYISESVSKAERKQADRELSKINKLLKELKEYETTMQKYAQKRIEIDLDDGVKTNYCKFQQILRPINGLCK